MTLSLNKSFGLYKGDYVMYTTERVISENKIHKEDVKQAIDICKAIINYQGNKHDNDKNEPENAEVLALALNTGDFTKWNEMHCMKQMHHYQCFMQSDKTTLFDLMECCADSVAACMRRKGENHTVEEEFEIFKRQGFDDFLAKVMANTYVEIQKYMILNNDEIIK